jgi:signal transduction histidine kinase
MVYARRRMLAETTRRALEAEHTREAVAAARVAEQRLATARHLHDVVGHGIAVINLQAGAAARTVRARPDDALDSLRIIQESSAAILGQIGELLRDLRGDAMEPRPALGIDALPSLIETLAAGGFVVDLQVAGEPRALSAETDDAAYRILEEALVNAYKHGASSAPAKASLRWSDDGLQMHISNRIDQSGREKLSTGFGVLGLQEQAQAVGGTAVATATDGVFDVTVRIPVPA